MLEVGRRYARMMGERMRLSTLLAVGLGLFISTAGAQAQDAKSVVDETSKAMGATGVTSIAYAGTAADVNFLQTRNINGPWPLRKITDYVRILDLSQTASRATGITSNQGLFGGAPAPIVHRRTDRRAHRAERHNRKFGGTRQRR